MPDNKTFCDCTQDGYCQRYGRIMSGRFREVCQGINCDLGTAAAFREQWRREYEAVNKFECAPGPLSTPIPILLKTDQAPGDAVVMTAAIYSLHKAHPGKYRTMVDSPYPEVFKYNPDVTEGPTNTQSIQELRMHYPAIHDSNRRGIHFMQAYCEFLGRALGINVPLMTNRPHLYLDHWAEPDVGGYWLVCSGGKADFTNKLWGFNRYQEVVNSLKDRVRFIQVGDRFMDHEPLQGVVWRVGQTNLRQLFEQVRRARGVLCGVSLLMHIAAALDKPAVVIAGGREPVAWNAYPRQHYLHTVGMLDCTDPDGRQGACWRSRVVPLGDSPTLDKDACLLPIVDKGTTPVPRCMTMISPRQVADLILKCNEQYDR